MHGEDVKLPGLTPIDGAQAFLVELKLFQIGDAGGGDVLLHPGVLDELRGDVEEAFGEVAEGAMGGFLHGEDVLHLTLGEDALEDEKFTERDTFARLGRSVSCGGFVTGARDYLAPTGLWAGLPRVLANDNNVVCH